MNTTTILIALAVLWFLGQRGGYTAPTAPGFPEDVYAGEPLGAIPAPGAQAGLGALPAPQAPYDVRISPIERIPVPIYNPDFDARCMSMGPECGAAFPGAGIGTPFVPVSPSPAFAPAPSSPLVVSGPSPSTFIEREIQAASVHPVTNIGDPRVFYGARYLE